MYSRSLTLLLFNAQRPGLRAWARPRVGAALRAGCAERRRSAARRRRWPEIARLRAAATTRDRIQRCTTIARRILNGKTPPALRAPRPACRQATEAQRAGGVNRPDTWPRWHRSTLTRHAAAPAPARPARLPPEAARDRRQRGSYIPPSVPLERRRNSTSI